MVRLGSRDDQLKRVAALLPGKVGDPGRRAADNRMFVKAMLWLARPACRIRCLEQRLSALCAMVAARRVASSPN